MTSISGSADPLTFSNGCNLMADHNSYASRIDTDSHYASSDTSGSFGQMHLDDQFGQAERSTVSTSKFGADDRGVAR